MPRDRQGARRPRFEGAARARAEWRVFLLVDVHTKICYSLHLTTGDFKLEALFGITEAGDEIVLVVIE
jgi:hypothetical protein